MTHPFLNEILNAGSLVAHFQPICSIRTKRVIGVEALCRGVHPTDGTLIPPNLLFEAAEEHGATVELDRLARRTALETYLPLYREVPDLALFLNFESSIIDRGVAGSGRLAELVRDLGINPANIIIEIVESRVTEADALQRFAATYKEMGCLIALDDVGSGHSNLERIAQLRPDILKIDRGLVNGIEREHHKREIFAAFSTLSHRIGAMVVAEGVETEADLLVTLDLGADLVQGFFLARPAPADQVALGDTATKTAALAESFRGHTHSRVRDEETARCEHARVLREIAVALEGCDNGNMNECLCAQVERFSGVECLYVLAEDGVQVSGTVFARVLAPNDHRFIFQPATLGADHSLKEYYLGLGPGIDDYLTGPYISLGSGRLCRTHSTVIQREGRRLVLCVDFLVDPYTSREK